MATTGLTGAEAARLLKLLGPNSIPSPTQPVLSTRLRRQFASPLIWLLLVALALDIGAWMVGNSPGLPLEAMAIGTILVFNASLGVFQEYRADAAVKKLRELAVPQAWVLRDGKLIRIPGSQLVTGDVVHLDAGTRIPADGIIVDQARAQVDESILTGEALPIAKAAGDSAFSGTMLLNGRAILRVERTGPSSTLGELAKSLETIEPEQTPLEAKFSVFGASVARWVLILTALLFVGGLLIEGLRAIDRILLFSVALAVAAVPEGMPAVLTLTLAKGMERMARHNALVRRMSAVEALGAVTVIGVDKTGTITENRMSVRRMVADDRPNALLAMVLASDAGYGDEAGDPLEAALFAYSIENGLQPSEVRDSWERMDVLPFDSTRKFMRVTCRRGQRTVHFLKGAPEVLLAMSKIDEKGRDRWTEALHEGAGEGNRVLALAMSETECDSDLTFLGLALLWDAPRPEVRPALVKVASAGIRVVMISGDHPRTALAIARSVGLATDGVITGTELDALEELPTGVNVYARIEPHQKLRLVELLKSGGDIVAMTGDGVNDAPAIKRADIGIAMGLGGSDVTREVADLVLLDDNFATIAHAIEEGRGIYANIQKFIRFLFSTNCSELIIVVAGALGSLALGLKTGTGMLVLPLTAVQLLWLNLVTDGLPALALGLDRNPGMMKASPRAPSAPLLDGSSARYVVFTGVALGAIGGVILLALRAAGLSYEAIRTSLFYYMIVAQVVSTFPARGPTHLRAHNRTLGMTVVLMIGVQGALSLVPSARSALGLVPIPSAALLALIAGATFGWACLEAYVHSRFYNLDSCRKPSSVTV